MPAKCAKCRRLIIHWDRILKEKSTDNIYCEECSRPLREQFSEMYIEQRYDWYNEDSPTCGAEKE